MIEAVCDGGASVSCLSSKVLDKLKEVEKLQSKPTTINLLLQINNPSQHEARFASRLKKAPKIMFTSFMF